MHINVLELRSLVKKVLYLNPPKYGCSKKKINIGYTK